MTPPNTSSSTSSHHHHHHQQQQNASAATTTSSTPSHQQPQQHSVATAATSSQIPSLNTLFPPDSFTLLSTLSIQLIKKSSLGHHLATSPGGAGLSPGGTPGTPLVPPQSPLLSASSSSHHNSNNNSTITTYYTAPRYLTLTLKKKKKQKDAYSPRMFVIKELMNGSLDRGRLTKLKRLEKVLLRHVDAKEAEHIRLLKSDNSAASSSSASAAAHSPVTTSAASSTRSIAANALHTHHTKLSGSVICTLLFQMYKPLEFIVTAQDRKKLLAFLAKMMKLCEDHFGNTPQVVGIEKADLWAALNSLDGSAMDPSSGGGALDQQEQFVTEEEERTLKRVLQQHALDIADPKTVISVLTERLKEMETQNIHEILERQDEWGALLEQLKGTKQQLSAMKQSLDSYHTELRRLKSDISQIEQKNNEMDVQSTNHEKLKEELQLLAKQFDFNKTDERIIQDWRFDDNQQLKEIKALVVRIENALTRDLGHGMDEMLAVQQRRVYLRDLRKRLVDRFIVFLQKQLSLKASQLLREAHKNASKDLMEQRETIYELKRYQELMPSVKCADLDEKKYYQGYLQLLNTYAQAMADPYQGQLKLFFKHTKDLVKRNDESKVSHMFFLGHTSSRSVSQMNQQSNVRGVSIGSPQGGSSVGSASFGAASTPSLMHNSDDDDSDADLSSIGGGTMTYTAGASSGENLRVDKAFSNWLTILCELVYSEEKFCCQFFMLDPTNEAFERKELKKMMDKMFKPLVTSANNYIQNLLTWIEKRTDLFYSLPMLNEVESKIARYTDESTWIVPEILQRIVTDMNQKIFTKFKEKQCSSIMSFRHQTKKLSVVPYFAQFPYFVERVERALRDNGEEQKRHHAENAYQTILSTMFTSLEKLAKMDSKHYNQFALKNYAFFSRVVFKNNVYAFGEHVGEVISSTIEDYVKKSSQRYQDCLQRYVVLTIRYRFKDLFEFFEGIEECRKTIDISDVKFQNAYTPTKLNHLIQDLQNNYKKYIEDCLKRMDKHIGPKSERSASYKVTITDYSLFGEVWAQLREYFLKRYQDFSILVRKCYTNLKLEPDPVSMTRAFTEIEAKSASVLQQISGGGVE